MPVGAALCCPHCCFCCIACRKRMPGVRLVHLGWSTPEISLTDPLSTYDVSKDRPKWTTFKEKRERRKERRGRACGCGAAPTEVFGGLVLWAISKSCFTFTCCQQKVSAAAMKSFEAFQNAPRNLFYKYLLSAVQLQPHVEQPRSNRHGKPP